jgi:hypothetical protein
VVACVMTTHDPGIVEWLQSALSMVWQHRGKIHVLAVLSLDYH